MKTEQDNIALEQAHQRLRKETKTKGKVSFSSPSYANFYLPSFKSVSEFLSLPSNTKQIIDMLEQEYQEPLKISRTNKYELGDKGVGITTIGKVLNWFKLLPIPFSQLFSRVSWRRITKSAKVNSHAFSWFSSISSFNLALNNANDETGHEFIPLLKFIEQRCDNDIAYLSSMRKKIENKDIDIEDKKIIWIHTRERWVNSTKIPTSTMDKFGSLFTTKDLKSLSQEKILLSIEACCTLFFDFFFEAITHYEVGCLKAYGGGLTRSRDNYGMITKALCAYANNNEIKTCFDALLHEFKSALQEHEVEDSWRKIASFIVINEESNSEYSELLNDKQYKRLKDWRKGKNLPSSESLMLFLDNLDKHAKKSSGYVLFIYCRIVIGFDKYIESLLDRSVREGCQRDEVEIIIKNVLAKIPSYYQINFDAHFKNNSSK